MDGTFNVCKVKVLLFVGLFLGDDGPGYPVFFMFFSALSETNSSSPWYTMKERSFTLTVVELGSRQRLKFLIHNSEPDRRRHLVQHRSSSHRTMF